MNPPRRELPCTPYKILGACLPRCCSSPRLLPITVCSWVYSGLQSAFLGGIIFHVDHNTTANHLPDFKHEGSNHRAPRSTQHTTLGVDAAESGGMRFVAPNVPTLVDLTDF